MRGDVVMLAHAQVPLVGDAFDASGAILLSPSPALLLPLADLTMQCQPLLLLHRLLPSARCHRRHRGLLVQPARDPTSPIEYEQLGLKNFRLRRRRRRPRRAGRRGHGPAGGDTYYDFARVYVGRRGVRGVKCYTFFLLRKWRDLNELIPMVRSVLDFSYFFDFS